MQDPNPEATVGVSAEPTQEEDASSSSAAPPTKQVKIGGSSGFHGSRLQHPPSSLAMRGDSGSAGFQGSSLLPMLSSTGDPEDGVVAPLPAKKGKSQGSSGSCAYRVIGKSGKPMANAAPTAPDESSQVDARLIHGLAAQSGTQKEARDACKYRASVSVETLANAAPAEPNLQNHVACP